MLEALMSLINVLMPLFVAVVTAYGAVMVAKLNKVQKSMTTNHGSKSLGDAIDIIRTKVDVISDNQDDLISTVKQLHQRDKVFDERLQHVEAVTLKTKEAVTGTIRVVRPPVKLHKRKRN